MGSPLGPVLANIFMCHLESSALNMYQGNQPLLYRRYMDDTFLIFNSPLDVTSFYDWMNSQHEHIKFTMEQEQDGRISFLDVLVTREPNGHLVTSVYRKPSFSGLYLRWDSFVPKQYKRGLVTCLLNHAWRLCSTYQLFHEEVTFNKHLLVANGYPKTS